MKLKIVTNIRGKLIGSFILLIVLIGSGSIIIGIKLINNNIIEQAYEQVSKHLDTAQYIYEQEGKRLSLPLKYIVARENMADAITTGNRNLLHAMLGGLKESLDADIIAVTDARGRVLVRYNNPQKYGDSVSSISCLGNVLREGKPCISTEIMDREMLSLEGDDFVKKAFVRVIHTPHERSLKKETEERALVQMAASPVTKNGRLVGVAYCAVIVNNSTRFVDRVKNLVFRDETVNGFDLGTATIFLDDVRISTNVKRQDGSRSIGTRVSAQVYNQVVQKGQVWLDKAFVVNKWYIAAYTPVFDINRKIIGIMYVGILEDKFNILKRETVGYFLGLIFLTSLIGLALAIYIVRGITDPVKSLMLASNEVTRGNFSYKIGRQYHGEMGQLCKTFDRMVDAIEEKDRMIKLQTQQQILQSEKLASLGRLASGIAHEINNPLTGVLTYSSLLYDDLKESQYGEDLKIIVDETMRCRSIVRGILDFARETRLEKQRTNLNKIILDSLAILEKHYKFQNVSIEKSLGVIPDFNVDVNQMISAINNFALNSADAMPGGGTITVKTWYEHEKQQVAMSITDTGAGIEKENLKRIFDPFFTTKETGQGTGLGLAVTYGIIERHGGSISVESTVGEGTTFTVKLPV